MEDLSIHPGVVNGRRIHSKVNTAKPAKNLNKGKLGAKQANLLRRRNDHSSTLRSLPSGSNPAAFKAPGSMNQHK